MHLGKRPVSGNPFLESYPNQMEDYLRFARYSGLGITMKLISLGLPILNIRCVECMKKRTMRARFVRIENLAWKIVDGVAPIVLSALALQLANGKPVAAEPFKAAMAGETK